MLGSLKRIVGETELANAAEALELGRADEANDEPSLRRVFIYGDEAMHGIAQQAFFGVDLKGISERFDGHCA